MVRETRYLLVGNIPEKCSEDVVSEYFKRYGKIQSVKLHGKKNATDEIISATVAFIDIRSASKAHNSENRLENNVLNTEYSEGHATGSAVTRTTAPAAPQVRSAYTIPRGSTAYSGSSRPKGTEEGEIYESGGSRDYYGRGVEASGQFQDNHFQSSFSEGGQYQRGRQKERFVRGNFLKQDRGGLIKQQRHSKDGSRLSFEQTSDEKSKSPGHSPSQASSRHSSNRRKKKTSHSRSRSKSRSRSGSSSSSSYSGSSSSSSRSGSHSSKSSSPSSVRKPHIPSSAILEVKSQGSTTSDRTEALGPDGERRPHGIRISNLPLRSSDTSLRDGLFHEYKKYGKVNAVQVSGAGEDRYAVVSFRKPEDAEKCVKESQGGKTFFGTKVKVILHDGIDFDDNEFRPPEAELDEYHPKATRTLFVGNLEKEISNQELKERFSKFGDIIDIDVKRQGAVSAYAFVQYSDISSVVKALKGMEGEHMGSMKLKLGFGKSMPTTCIWLDNVAETVTESFVSRQFNRYGNVTSTVIDHIRGKALVYFNSMDSAQFALNEMRNRIFNGKKIMIDFASRECQNGFFDKMEKSGQLKPGQRPDERTRGWQQYNRQTSNDGQWEGGRTFEKRGGFTQYAGRGKWGRGYQKNWSGNFQGRTFSSEEHQARRQRSYDEYSQGGNGDDSFEQDLRDYSYSQQERRERGSVSPGEYSDDMYGDPAYQFTAKDERSYSERYKDGHYPEGYRSESPGSDGGGAKSYSEDRYIYGKSRSDSFFNKERYGSREKVGDQSPDAWSRSPQFREANKDSNYGRNTPPTPVDDEPNDFSSLDHSPMDLESNQRRYGDYKRKVGGKTDDFDITEADIEEIRTSNIIAASSVKHRKESTSQRPQDRFIRKRSYDEFAHDSKLDDSHRLERQTSRTNRDKFAEKRDLYQKVQRIQSQIGRCKGNSGGNGNEGSTSSSSSDSERGSMTETELSKLQHEKLSLLEKLKQLEKEGSMSDAESANDLEDSRKVISSKRPRLDPKSPWPPSSVIVEPKKPPHNLYASQSFRKQMEQLRKMEEQSKKDEKQRTVTKENKYDSESEDHLGGCLSPKEIPSEFILKKRKKYDNSDDVGFKSRSYRPKKSEDDDHRSSELDDSGRIKGDNPPYHRMSSGHSSPRTPITPQFSSEHLMEHHRQHSESDLSASESQQAGSKETGRRRDSGGKEWGQRSHRDDHQPVIIPLGDDTPSQDLIDPRTKQIESEPVFLPLPLFAQYARPIINSPIVEDSPKYDMLKNDSPCFSPPSSGSKNASPQTSPNNDFESGDSQETPQNETNEFVKPLDEPSQEVENDTSVTIDKETDKPTAELDSEEYSDSNSELDSPDKLSLEERIRRLDEKLNAAPAPPTTTSKTMDSSSPHTSTISSTFNAAAAANQQPSSDLYRKYKIKKKNDSTGTGSGDSKSEPSEIVKTMLARSSIFDQDTKRLEQINEKYQPRSVSLDVGDSPKLGMVRTKAAAKEMPLSTLPGSLAGRLGNGASSFPTLSVNTSIGGDPNKLDNMSPSESSMASDSCPVSPSAAAILASQKDNLWLEGGLMPSEYSYTTEDRDIEHSTSAGYTCNSGLLNTVDSSSDKCNANSDLTSSKDEIKIEKDVSEDKDESSTEQTSVVDNTKNTSVGKVDNSSSLFNDSNCDKIQEDSKSSLEISKPFNYKDVLSKSDSSNSSAISTSVYSNTENTELMPGSTNQLHCSDVKSEKPVTTNVKIKSENSEKESILSSKVNSDNNVKSDINNSNIGNLITGDSESASKVNSGKLTSELKSLDSDKSDNLCVESSSDNKDNLMEIDSSDRIIEDQSKTQESLDEERNSAGLKSDSNLTSLEASDAKISEKVDSEPLFSLGKRKADTDDSIQTVIEQNQDTTSASKSDSSINTNENKENNGKCSQPEPKKPKITREKSAESQNGETNDRSESSDKNVQQNKEKNSEEKKRDKVEGDSVLKKESSGGQKKDKDKDGNKDKISGSSTSSSSKSSSTKSTNGKHHDKSPSKSSNSSSKSSRDKSPAKAPDNKHHDKSKSGGNSSDSKKDSSSDKKSEHSSHKNKSSSSSSSSKSGDSKTKDKTSHSSSSSSSKGENVDKSQKDDHSQKSSKPSKTSSTDDSTKAQDKSKHSEKSNTADESTSKSTSKSSDKVTKHSDKTNSDGHTSSKSHSSHSEKSSSHSSKSSKDSSKDSDKSKSSSSKLKSSSSVDKGSEHKSKSAQDSEKSKDKDKQTSDTTNTAKQKHTSSSTSSASDVTKDTKHKTSADDQKHKNKHSDDKSSSKQKHKEDGKHKSTDKSQNVEKKTSTDRQSSIDSKTSNDVTTEKKQNHDLSEKKTASKSTTGDKKLSNEKKTKEKTDSKVTKSENKSVEHKSEKTESKKESTVTSNDKKGENKTEKLESKSKENKSQQNTDKKQETTAAKSEEKKSETSDKADNKTDNKKKEKSTKSSTPVKSVKDQKNIKDKGKTKHQEMVESKTKSSHDKTKKQSKEKVSVDSIDSSKDQGKKSEKENDQKKSNKKEKAEKKNEPTAEVEFDWEAWQGPYVSMYDKVKRRSTEKDKERELETMRKKLDQLQKNRNKRSTVSMSDETNSTDFNTDDDSDDGPTSKPVSKSKKEKSKKMDTSQKRKKYVLDTSSSSDDDDDTSAFTKSPIGKKPPAKDNALIKAPKSSKKASILDIYSSDSEEEENRNLASEASFDLPSSNKKKPVKKVKDSNNSDKLVKKKDDENDKLKKTKQPKKVQEKKVEKPNYLGFSSDISADDLSDHLDDSDSDINLMKKKSTSKKMDKKATQKAIRKIYSSSSSDEDSSDERNILQEHKSSVDQSKPKTLKKDTPKKTGKSIFDFEKMSVKDISHFSDSEQTNKTETVLQKMEKEIDIKEEDQKSVDKSSVKHDKTNKKKRKDQKENILLGEGKLEIGKSIGTKKEEGKIGLFEKMETYLRTDISDKSPGKECLLNKFDEKMFSKSTVSSETVNIINDITTESIKAKKHKKEGKKDKKKMDKENAQHDLSSELKNINLCKDELKNKINCDIIDSVSSLHNLKSPEDKCTPSNLETDQKDSVESDIIKSDKNDKKSKKKKKERQISGSSVSSDIGCKEAGLQSPVHIEPSRQSSIDQSLPSIDDDKVKKSKKVKNEELFGDKSENKMDTQTVSESTEKDTAESAKISDNKSLMIEPGISSKSDQIVLGDQDENVKTKKGKKKKRSKSGSGDSDVSSLSGKEPVSSFTGEVTNQFDMSASESSYPSEQTGGDNQQDESGKVKKGKKKKKDKSEQDPTKKHKKKDKEKHENEEGKSKKKEKHDNNEDGKSKKKEKKKKKKKDLLETQSSSETLSNEQPEDQPLVIDTTTDITTNTSEKVDVTSEHTEQIPVENVQTSDQIHESITSSMFQVQTVEIKNSSQVKDSDTEHKNDKKSKAGDIFEFNEDDDDETTETKGNWKPLRVDDSEKRKHKLYTSDSDSARKSSNDDSKLFWSSDNETTTKLTETSHHSSVFDNETEKFNLSSESGLTSNLQSSNDDHSHNEQSTSAANEEQDVFDNVISDVEVTVSQNDVQSNVEDHVHGLQIAADLQDLDSKLVINTDIPKSDTSTSHSTNKSDHLSSIDEIIESVANNTEQSGQQVTSDSFSDNDHTGGLFDIMSESQGKKGARKTTKPRKRRGKKNSATNDLLVTPAPNSEDQHSTDHTKSSEMDKSMFDWDKLFPSTPTKTETECSQPSVEKSNDFKSSFEDLTKQTPHGGETPAIIPPISTEDNYDLEKEALSMSFETKKPDTDEIKTETKEATKQDLILEAVTSLQNLERSTKSLIDVSDADNDGFGEDKLVIDENPTIEDEEEEQTNQQADNETALAIQSILPLDEKTGEFVSPETSTVAVNNEAVDNSTDYSKDEPCNAEVPLVDEQLSSEISPTSIISPRGKSGRSRKTRSSRSTDQLNKESIPVETPTQPGIFNEKESVQWGNRNEIQAQQKISPDNTGNKSAEPKTRSDLQKELVEQWDKFRASETLKAGIVPQFSEIPGSDSMINQSGNKKGSRRKRSKGSVTPVRRPQRKSVETPSDDHLQYGNEGDRSPQHNESSDVGSYGEVNDQEPSGIDDSLESGDSGKMAFGNDLIDTDLSGNLDDGDKLSDEASQAEVKRSTRGRKIKNYKEMNSGVLPRTSSPRSRISPRSPRNVTSPKQQQSPPKSEIASPVVKIERLPLVCRNLRMENEMGGESNNKEQLRRGRSASAELRPEDKSSEVLEPGKSMLDLSQSELVSSANESLNIVKEKEPVYAAAKVMGSTTRDSGNMAKDAANVFDFDGSESEMKLEPVKIKRKTTRRRKPGEQVVYEIARPNFPEKPVENRFEPTKQNISQLQPAENLDKVGKFPHEAKFASTFHEIASSQENKLPASQTSPVPFDNPPNLKIDLRLPGECEKHVVGNIKEKMMENRAKAMANVTSVVTTLSPITPAAPSIPTTPATPMSNIDKIIDNVSKGIFNWTDVDTIQTDKSPMPHFGVEDPAIQLPHNKKRRTPSKSQSHSEEHTLGGPLLSPPGQFKTIGSPPVSTVQFMPTPVTSQAMTGLTKMPVTSQEPIGEPPTIQTTDYLKKFQKLPETSQPSVVYSSSQTITTTSNQSQGLFSMPSKSETLKGPLKTNPVMKSQQEQMKSTTETSVVMATPNPLLASGSAVVTGSKMDEKSIFKEMQINGPVPGLSDKINVSAPKPGVTSISYPHISSASGYDGLYPHPSYSMASHSKGASTTTIQSLTSSQNPPSVTNLVTGEKSSSKYDSVISSVPSAITTPSLITTVAGSVQTQAVFSSAPTCVVHPITSIGGKSKTESKTTPVNMSPVPAHISSSEKLLSHVPVSHGTQGPVLVQSHMMPSQETGKDLTLHSQQTATSSTQPVAQPAHSAQAYSNQHMLRIKEAIVQQAKSEKQAKTRYEQVASRQLQQEQQQRPPSAHSNPHRTTGLQEIPRPSSAHEQFNQHSIQEQIRNQLMHAEKRFPQMPSQMWHLQQQMAAVRAEEKSKSGQQEYKEGSSGLPHQVSAGLAASAASQGIHSQHPQQIKSPALAQTAPSPVAMVIQSQSSMQRPSSPISKKTTEKPQVGRWAEHGIDVRVGGQNEGQRSRPPSREITSPHSAQWGFHGTGPASLSHPSPQPAHQQIDHAAQQREAKARLIQQQQQQQQQSLQRQQELFLLQREQREQIKKQQDWKRQQQEQQDQELKRLAHLSQKTATSQPTASTSSTTTDSRQTAMVQAQQRMASGIPAHVDGKSVMIDPRFAQQHGMAYPPHGDLRRPSSQTPSAFTPPVSGAPEIGQGIPAHLYNAADLQRLHQAGVIPVRMPPLAIDPHLYQQQYLAHISPHYLSQHAAGLAVDHSHLQGDNRPPSQGGGHPSQGSLRSPTGQSQQQLLQQISKSGGHDALSRLQESQMHAVPPRPLPDPPPGERSLLSLLQGYPVMWQGVLALKNDNCVVQMHVIAGLQQLVKMALPQQGEDGTVQPLRIAQRMRLEAAQLDGVAKRMQYEKDFCMLLALPCGRDHDDIIQQTRAMSSGFIQYLQQKQAAGIVNVADQGSQQPAYVVHIFPPCEFSHETLGRLGFELMHHVRDLAHLLVIVTTVA